MIIAFSDFSHFPVQLRKLPTPNDDDRLLFLFSLSFSLISSLRNPNNKMSEAQANCRSCFKRSINQNRAWHISDSKWRQIGQEICVQHRSTAATTTKNEMFAQHHDCWWVFTPLLIVEAGNVQCHRIFVVCFCVCRINYKPVIVCRRIYREVKKIAINHLQNAKRIKQ